MGHPVLSQLYLPGSGIALELFSLAKSQGLEMLVVSKFTEEGDNTRDGVEVADMANAAISWTPGTQYSVPHSWRMLFGAPAPAEMFW